MAKLKPEWKVEIGSGPITLESKDIPSINTTTTVHDECGVFTIPLANTDGKYKSSVNMYDEVKIYYRYEGESYVQELGGHVDKVRYNLSSNGDMMYITGRTYEEQFFFKNIYGTWMYTHWSTILGDIVDDVNDNITTNFTTNFISAVEQVTETTNTVDIDDVYNGTEVVGQVIKPNESYLATVVVKGYKEDDPTEDLVCSIYRCKDSGGADENTLADVDWAQTVGGSLLGSNSMDPQYITDDSSNPQEISFQMDTSGLDTDNLYMLVFAKETDTATGRYYLRYNTAGGYTDGDYFADGSRVSGDDLWFKLNALCFKAEDRKAFDCMREISGRVLRDWYSDTSKVVQCVERLGSVSVKTFTAGEDIILLNFEKDVTSLVNKIIVSGIPEIKYIPKDKDEWTETDIGSWEVSYDETASNTALSSQNLGPDHNPVGAYNLLIYRTSTGNNTIARVRYPPSGSYWDSTTGLDRRVKAICFWVAGINSAAAVGKLRFNLTLANDTPGTTWHKDIYISCPATGYSGSVRDLWQFVTIKLPNGGNRRKWMDDTSDSSPELLTYAEAETLDIVSALPAVLQYLEFYFYANNDGVTDGTIMSTYVDGMHFILEDDNRIEVNISASQAVFDTREHTIRDESLDNYPSVEAKAKMIKRLRGDGDTSWTGTPGDTKDIQLTGTLEVIGNTDVSAGDTITIIYPNGNISMDVRVHSVSHSITSQTGWRTIYEIAMLLPQVTLARAITSTKNQSVYNEGRKPFAANFKQQLNLSSYTEEGEV